MFTEVSVPLIPRHLRTQRFESKKARGAFPPVGKLDLFAHWVFFFGETCFACSQILAVGKPNLLPHRFCSVGKLVLLAHSFFLWVNYMCLFRDHFL